MKARVFPVFLILSLAFSCVAPQKATVETETTQPVKEEVTIQKKEIEQDIIGLKEFFKDNFLIGAAVEPSALKFDGHAELLLKHFSSITPENVMKPIIIHPQEDKYNFRPADEIVAFAREHNLGVRGHTLIWYNQCPEWFFVENGKKASKETLRKRMKDHITEIMQRYKGKIYAWDVVNEPIDQGKPDGMHRNKWYDILGEEYVELAFRYAKEADPDAKLILNEWGCTIYEKRQYLLALIKRLQSKGVPVDGVGMQMHITLTAPYMAEIDKALKDFSDAGLEIHITELDVSVYDNRKDKYTSIGKEILNEQGHRLKDVFSLYKKYDKNVTSVSFWGLADDSTWLKYHFVEREDWPLPFDVNLKAKPFYWGLVDPSKLTPRINMAKAAEGSAVVDGKEDSSWQYPEFFPNIPITTGLSFSVKAQWDKAYLYILLDVADTTPLQNDAITFFINENNKRSQTMDSDDRTIDFVLDKGFKNSKDAAVLKKKGGYVFEARIPFNKIEGAKDIAVGFDVLVKDGEKAYIKWNDQETVNSTNPGYWGVLNLVKTPKIGKAYYGTPVLDAKKDDLYKGPPMPIKEFISGIGGEEFAYKGATGNAWALWNDEAVSVYIEVNDQVLSVSNDLVYMQDSVEVFIDENNKKTPSYEKDDGQFRVNYENLASFGSTGSVKGFQSAARIIDGGYAVEMIIPFRALIPEAGTTIGFDLQINDDQGSGKRDNISKWNDLTNDSWQSTAGYGVLEFVK
ncbi:MAG: endo-1,4-beta-xylanase [Spirochaetales bacterium]|nr:endo-1,4-beta-xylanase [Spirochaetales bacterium]